LSAIEPAPEAYIRAVTLRILRGETVELPMPEAEPSNVFDIREARTKRATALMIRRRGEL
jgi:hypothetical protein